MFKIVTISTMLLLLFAVTGYSPMIAADAKMHDTKEGAISGGTTFEQEATSPSNANETDSGSRTNMTSESTSAIEGSGQENQTNMTSESTSAIEGSGQENQTSQMQSIDSNFLVYDNPFLGFSILYPTNWNVENMAFGEGTVRFISHLDDASDRFSETVDVFVYEPGIVPYFQSADTSLEDVEEGLTEYLGQILNDFNLMGSNSSTLSDLPAITIEYAYSDEVIGSTHVYEVFAISDGKLYDVFFSAKPDEFESKLQLGQLMINSLQIDSSVGSNSTSKE